MDPSPIAVAKLLVPQIPAISFTAFQHTLGFSHTSSVWDLRTALTMHVLRNIMNADNGRRKRQPIEKVQERTLAEPGMKGDTWIATATMKKPDDGARGVADVVCKAVEDMKPGDVTYTKPEVTDIEVEWTGYRPGAGKDAKLPSLSDEEMYKKLMADVKSEVTVLYFHGGAYYLCDPKTHRMPVSKLAQYTGGRVASVRYRLAPQTAFPGQLIDALMVYLSLLYPPEGSFHDAVPAEKIVLAGDSAGGNLSFALLQLLLHFHRSSPGVPVVQFHGRDVHVPLPAGVSANSGWFDISRSLPSLLTNAKFDYLPVPNHDDALSEFPHDKIWPTMPLRGDFFCDLSLLDHPLASMHIAESWKDSPPLWFCTGQEMLSDEDRLVASRALNQGATVQFEEYEAMPHCFQMLIPHLKTSDRCLRSWADWMKKCVEAPASLKNNGVYVHAKTGKEDVLDIQALKPVEYEEAKRLCKEAKEKRVKGFQKWEQGLSKSAL